MAIKRCLDTLLSTEPSQATGYVPSRIEVGVPQTLGAPGGRVKGLTRPYLA